MGNPRIRVVFHLDSLAIGGLEKKVAQLALRLDRERFDPVVTYSWQWGPYGDELRSKGIPVELIVPAVPAIDAAAAVQKIRALSPQIFHSFSCRQDACDVWAARQAQAPFVLTARGNMRHWTAAGPARNWEFDRNRMTDVVTACCDAVAQLASRVEGIHPEKLAVIHNGVDTPRACGGPTVRDELGIAAGAFLVGYAARYRKVKAHESLLNAWKGVTAACPDAILVCCGDDEEERKGKLEELVCKLGLTRNVLLLDARRDMDSFYRGLNLYVHASRSEGLSNAILEAMSYGLPVVATAAGGNVELIADGVSGILTAPQTTGMTEAVLRLAGESATCGAMGEAARARVREQFSVARMVKGYESLYQSLVETGRPRGPLPATAPPFTGAAGDPVLDDITVFVTTIGDKTNFDDCMAHLHAQTVRCRIEVIDRVAPMSAAFARMHARCTTRYYVQVDEDMMLYPHALATLREMMDQSDAGVPLVCVPLWDCDVERPILGVKIYRHEVVCRFPYRDTLSCEVEQLRRMADAGHIAVVLSTHPDAQCLGEHGKHYSPQTIFRRWQRLFHKHNELGNQRWADPWPRRLLQRYQESGEQLHLWALLGAVAGISGRADGDREFDWRETNPASQRLLYYFPPGPAEPE